MHAILFSYFWLGLFVGGLVAPAERVWMLESHLVTEGWQLTVLSMVLVLPAPMIYLFRMKYSSEDTGREEVSDA
ncbi:MAG: hypothetical protein CMH56_01875 [Myxococcales bacterium]|nr:hypothetical protein [Myxococcales bacterium]